MQRRSFVSWVCQSSHTTQTRAYAL